MARSNPFPEISDRLLRLLFAWVEWRSCQGQPRGVCMPRETHIHRIRISGQAVLAEPVASGYCLERGTAPRRDGWQPEFSQAFLALAPDQRAWLLIMAAMQDQPWLRGRKWRDLLRELGLKPRHYARLASDALGHLGRAARARGLV